MALANGRERGQAALREGLVPGAAMRQLRGMRLEQATVFTEAAAPSRVDAPLKR